jgi:hypothetical protein
MRLSKFKVVSAVLFLVIGSALGLFAAYPLATDDAGSIVGLNSYELEIGYDNCRDENELINHTCGISFKHGITEKMDIGLSIPFQLDPSREESLGEASLTLKFSLIKDMLAFSFSNESGEKDYFLNAVCTKDFKSVVLNLNAGYLSSGDETVRGYGTYGVSLEKPFGKFDLVGELQGQEGGSGNWLAGLRYWVTESFFVAAGFSRAFDSNTNRGTTGFHFEF